jgi:hypothetical protein
MPRIGRPIQHCGMIPETAKKVADFNRNGWQL